LKHVIPIPDTYENFQRVIGVEMEDASDAGLEGKSHTKKHSDSQSPETDSNTSVSPLVVHKISSIGLQSGTILLFSLTGHVI
jgi:hypothetical protein